MTTSSNDETSREHTPQTSLVTGSTGGVGRAVTLALAARRDNLTILGRRSIHVDDLVALATCASSIHPFVGDLTSSRFVQQVGTSVSKAASGLDLLVHAAGTFSHAGVQDFDDQEYQRVFGINVGARFQLTRELLPSLRQRGGLVVFLNSTVGLRSPAGPGLYAASMHAMRAATDAFRQEVNPSGVRVLSIFLGRTATPMQEKIHEADCQPYKPRQLIQPETVASLILRIAELPRDTEVTDLTLRPLKVTAA